MTRETADAAFKGFAAANRLMSKIGDKTFVRAFGSTFELFKVRSDTGCNISFGEDMIYITQRDEPSPWEFKANRSDQYFFDAVITKFMYPLEAKWMMEGLRKRLQNSKL
jgi:hypothetical protein